MEFLRMVLEEIILFDFIIEKPHGCKIIKVSTKQKTKELLYEKKH